MSAKPRKFTADGGEVLRRMAPDFQNPPHWDVEVMHVVGGEEKGDEGERVFRVHKSVLAANSGFFRLTFSPEWIEAGNGRVNFSEKEHGIKAVALEIALMSMYSKTVEITAENVYEVHAAANFLQMDSQLSIECCEFIQASVTIENVLSVWRYARMVFPGSDTVRAYCESLIYENFKKMYSSVEFGELKTTEVKDLISNRPREPGKVDSENVDAMLTWVIKNWAENFKDVVSLTDAVKWNRMRGVDRAKIPSVDLFATLLCTSVEQKVVKSDLWDILMAQSQCEDRANQNERSTILVFGAESRQDTVALSVSEFNFSTNAWNYRRRHVTSGGRRYQVHAMFSCESSVIVVFSSHSPPDSFLSTDLKASVFSKGRFDQIVDLSVPAQCSSVDSFSVTGNYVCICCRNQFGVSKILLYDIRNILAPGNLANFEKLPVHVVIDVSGATPSWEMKSNAIYLNGEVYVLDGHTLRVFNLNTKAWRVGSTLGDSCSFNPYMFLADGMLYCVMFAGKETTVFWYMDPALRSGTWRKGPDLLCIAFGTMTNGWKSHFVLNGRLYVAGRCGLFTAACLSSKWVVQSIDLRDMAAGWRKEMDTDFVQDSFKTVFFV